jgi:hypothetical protein
MEKGRTDDLRASIEEMDLNDSLLEIWHIATMK